MTMSANEATRRMTVIGWLDTILRDLKYTFRMLARTPGFTAVAVLTLALGIGANTAIFTLLDQVLLRLLPVKDPQQLVLLTMKGRHYGSNWGGNAISHPMFRDFQDHNEVFSENKAGKKSENSSARMPRSGQRTEFSWRWLWLPCGCPGLPLFAEKKRRHGQ